MFETVEEARLTAETKIMNMQQHNVYVYSLNGKFGLYWQDEDKYAEMNLPDYPFSEIVLHGAISWPIGLDHKVIVWDDQRDDSATLDTLKDSLGGEKGQAAWDTFHEAGE